MSDGHPPPPDVPPPAAQQAPPGYGPPPGHHPGQPGGPAMGSMPPPHPGADPQGHYGAAPAAAEPFGRGPGIGLWLALGAVAAVSVGVFVKEDGANFWDGSEVWSIFAIVAAAFTLTPGIGSSAGWEARRSWAIGAIAAGGLAGWWVLIVLPGIGSNLGFLNTIGTVLGCAAIWLSDGRPDPDRDRTPTTW